MARSAVILRISIAKRHVDAGTYSPSTTNEKRMTKAQRNLLKREQSQPEHQAPERYVEVATNSLHRIQAAYIPVHRGSLHPPRRSGYPRVDEVESRGWGRRAPQSPSSSSFGAPQGNNEIYTYDVVFLIGETKTYAKSPTQFPYPPPRGVNKIYTYDVVFSPGEARKKNQRTTQFPYKITKGISKRSLISRLQVRKTTEQVQLPNKFG